MYTTYQMNISVSSLETCTKNQQLLNSFRDSELILKMSDISSLKFNNQFSLFV